MTKKAVIYARYSCDKQTEQSIEGQIRVIKEHADSNGFDIVGEYIDRAKSATTANRPSFLRMISDSDRHQWEYVIVYKLDRFSRNRYDSAFYKRKLKVNGVSVVSATERLSDNPESIITEALLEAMAEFYSAELGQKTKRGMRESALKCQSTGAVPPLGYKWGDDKKLHIDDSTAEIPRIVYHLYADGKGKKAIADELNRRGYRTRTGKPFKTNSFDSMLRNKKYIGIYTYGDDIEIEEGCPALIDRETYNKVQEKLAYTKKAPARARTKVEYYLSGKLYCGLCGERLIAVGGTSRNGTQHHYYRCKHKECRKKAERKDYIEWYITQEILELLNMDQHRERLADKVIAAYKSGMQTDRTDDLIKQIESLKTKQHNIADLLIERGKSTVLLDKFDAIELQISELQEELKSADLAGRHIPTQDDILRWFDRLSDADEMSESLIKQVINTFVQQVYLWDDKAVIVLTLQGTEKTVTFEQIREYEEMAEDDGSRNIDNGSPCWT